MVDFNPITFLKRAATYIGNKLKAAWNFLLRRK